VDATYLQALQGEVDEKERRHGPHWRNDQVGRGITPVVLPYRRRAVSQQAVPVFRFQSELPLVDHMPAGLRLLVIAADTSRPCLHSKPSCDVAVQ